MGGVIGVASRAREGLVKLTPLHRKFLQDLRALGRSTATIIHYESDFQVFLKFLPRDDVRDMTALIIQRYPAWLARRGYAAATIRRRIDSAASFARWLTRRREIRFNPFDALERPKRPKGLPRPVLPDDCAALLGACRTPRDRALFQLMRCAGLRVGEVERLDLGDVDLLAGVLMIRQGKGGKDRAIPLAADLRGALVTWCLERGDLPGPLFPGRVATRVGRRQIGRLLARLCKQAGIPRVAPHKLRHTFCTEAIEAGVALPDLQLLAGHEDPQTTMRYVSVRPSRLQAAVDRVAELRENYRALLTDHE